jgi:hypothetical protein
MRLLRKVLFWTAFWGVWAAALYGAIVLAVPAHADMNSDFLGCLSNRGVTYKDQAKVLELRDAILADLANQRSTVYIEALRLQHGGSDLSSQVALATAQCAQASEWMGGH